MNVQRIAMVFVACIVLTAATVARADEPAKPRPAVPVSAIEKVKALGYYLDGQNERGDVGLYFGGPSRKPHTAEIMTLLPRIPNLTLLIFEEGDLTLADLQAIAAAPRLKSLKILKGSIPDGAAKELSASASLETLTFDRGLTTKPFGDADLADLARIKTLKSLELRFPVSPTAKGLKAIAGLPNLELLWLTSPELDDEGLKALAPLAPRLKSLALDSRKLTPDGWNALGQFKNLESLWLMDSSIDGRSMGGIGKLTELRTLTLVRTGVSDVGMKALGGLKKLKTLIVSETRVTDEGLKHLENLTSLVELQIGNTAITAKGLMYLGKNQRMGMVLGRGSKIADADMPKLEKLFPNCEIVSGNGLFNGTTKKEPGKELPPTHQENSAPKDPKSERTVPAKMKGLEQKLTNSLDMQFVRIPAGKLPRLPGKAPVFAVVTKVDAATETFSFFLLFDEIVNTDKIVEDEKGVVKNAPPTV